MDTTFVRSKRIQQKAAESLADPRANVSQQRAMSSVQAVIDAKRNKNARIKAGLDGVDAPSKT
jgi:hypothetical protein